MGEKTRHVLDIGGGFSFATRLLHLKQCCLHKGLFNIILENSPDEADNCAQLFSITLPEEIAPVRDETIVVQAQMTPQEFVQLAVAEVLRDKLFPSGTLFSHR